MPRQLVRPCVAPQATRRAALCSNGRVEDVARHESASEGARLRLFATLELPREAAGQLAACSEAMVPADGGARPLAAEAMHLTFAFLGDVDAADVAAVARHLDEAARAIPGPALCTTDALASLGGGRVVGVGIHLDLLPVVDAARDGFLRAVHGCAPDADRRAWLPHVTLLRLRDRGGPGLLQVLPSCPGVAWVARDLQLVASLPAPGGRQYRVLHAASLGRSSGG